MNVYDELYLQNAAYYGIPFPAILAYFGDFPQRGRLLDMGCGQGRNAIPLAESGYEVTAVDSSKVATDQLKHAVKRKGLKITVECLDMYGFSDYGQFDFILFDAVFHFYPHEMEREMEFVRQVISRALPDTRVAFCIHSYHEDIDLLKSALGSTEISFEKFLSYSQEDFTSGLVSHSEHYFVVVKV